MNIVNTVLGPRPADELGVVAVHESLLSVVPGAEHAFDVSIDRADIFEVLARKLTVDAEIAAVLERRDEAARINAFVG